MSVLYDYYHSPIGTLKIAVSNNKLAGLECCNDADLATALPTAVSNSVKIWLNEYFQGGQPGAFDMPIALSGSEFQLYIWKKLMGIPFGQYSTYGQIAKQAAIDFNKSKISAQAVGQAVAKNPLLIIVPCHRVIGGNNKITGFSAGLEIKKWLLEHENIIYK